MKGGQGPGGARRPSGCGRTRRDKGLCARLRVVRAGGVDENYRVLVIMSFCVISPPFQVGGASYVARPSRL